MSLHALLGPPGSGKGEAERFLMRLAGAQVLDTGSALRAYTNHDPSPEAKALRKRLAQGHMASLEVVAGIIARWTEESMGKGPMVWSGFPRNLDQARWALEASDRYPMDGIIHLTAPREVLRSRIGARLVCPTCQGPDSRNRRCRTCGEDLVRRPEDDDPVATERRLDAWFGEGIQVLELLRAGGLQVHTVNAHRDKEAVCRDILALVRPVPAIRP